MTTGQEINGTKTCGWWPSDWVLSWWPESQNWSNCTSIVVFVLKFSNSLWAYRHRQLHVATVLCSQGPRQWWTRPFPNFTFLTHTHVTTHTHLPPSLLLFLIPYLTCIFNELSSPLHAGVGIIVIAKVKCPDSSTEHLRMFLYWFIRFTIWVLSILTAVY